MNLQQKKCATLCPLKLWILVEFLKAMRQIESGFATKTITKPSKTHFSGVRKQLRSMMLWLFLKLVTFNMSVNSRSLAEKCNYIVEKERVKLGPCHCLQNIDLLNRDMLLLELRLLCHSKNCYWMRQTKVMFMFSPVSCILKERFLLPC